MLNYKNFTLKGFIDYVIENADLGNLNEKMRFKIEKEIATAFQNRVVTTMFDLMDEENVKDYKELREKNTKLDAFDALIIMADTIPAIQPALIKNVNDLAQELITTAKMLDHKDKRVKKTERR